MHYPTDAEWADKLKTDIDAGTLSFADAARDNSDNAEAAEGGDIGWIGKGQLDEAKEAAIFAAPDRQGQRPAHVVPDEGIYLFLVDKEETREPDAEQRRPSRAPRSRSGTRKQKAAFDITRDDGDHRPDELTRRGAGGPMLDALLAEARVRWGLDPAAGLAVVVAERLVATPVEPSLPVLVVPAARLRVAPPAPDAVPAPLPGRHGARRPRPARGPAPPLPGGPPRRPVRRSRGDHGRAR